MAFLILADGTVFEGKSIGAKGKVIGETVFTTGMTGYPETLTDPSYFGQIVTQTFPLIGNYGVIPEDYESKKCHIRGYIVRELCEKPSNFRTNGDLDGFLKAQNIIGICGIDTRKLTKILREAGVMNGMLVSDDVCPEVTPALLEEIKKYVIVDAVKSVQGAMVQEPLKNAVEPKLTEFYTKGYADGNGKKVALFDFGAKANIQRELERRGLEVTVVPYDTTAEKIISEGYDGVMLSNGPGDPAENVGVIAEIKKLCDYGKLPIFGICLGHQMLALANGARTSKLKYGHRGGNQPVKDLESGRVYISSQNHGYAVENDTLPANAKLSFINTNDGTCEGVNYTNIPAFSVQFHPEACGGPHDTNFLFDKFVRMIK
ncbi:MAG: carbamoyl phosphate synthase small subunit [Treponema sp.]|nr:carbamoyl phosphate synthase small subunit [Candidatus Treponema equifaecale]